MTVAYTFATRTSSIPLSELDANFATATTFGNVSFQLGNVVTTIGNLTLTNVTISSGTATLGNVSFGNVTYTGTLTGGTGVVNLGSGQLYKDASGNLGIGTNNPQARVNIAGNDQSNVRLRFTNTGGSGRSYELVGGYPGTNNSNFSIFDATASTIPFSIEAATPTNTLLLNASGNVGIGTSSPASKLHVSNSAAATRITITDDVANGRSGYIESNFSDALVIGTTSGVRGIRFSPDNTPRMFLDTSGNLGIGTSSPSARLHVGASGGTIQLRLGNNTGLDYWGIGRDNVTTGDLVFQGQTTEYMRLTASGNLLVGTTSTGADGLGIRNTLNLTFAEGSGTSYANLFRQTSSGATVIANGYKWSNTASGFASSIGTSWAKTAIGLGVGTGAITFYTDSAGTVANGTDVTPSERARITSAGDFIHQVNGTAPSLSTNGTMSFELTSNTSLKIVVRGTDGVTRSTTLTLT